MRDIVKQLKREVDINRQKISKSSAEIVSFCEKEREGDPMLLKGTNRRAFGVDPDTATTCCGPLFIK